MSTWIDVLGLIVIGGMTWLALPYVLSGNIGGGGTVIGANVYKTTGRTCKPYIHMQPIGCGGRNNVPSQRADVDSCSFTAYEATAIIRFGGGCGCGDEATIKHFGPSHHDGNCCWALSAVMQNGDCCFGGEGPHPNTTKCQMKLGNVGNLVGKTVAIKSIIWKTSSGAHQELYVDTTAALGRNWRAMGSRNISQWGNSQTSNRIAATGGPQQIEFRCDCSQAKWLAASVAEIYVPAGRYAQAYVPPEPQKPSMKLEELEQQLAYHTFVPQPPKPEMQVVETYLAKKQRQLVRY